MTISTSMDTVAPPQDATEAVGSVAEAFFHNATARRIDTDAVLLKTIQNNHPGVPVTTVPELHCNLKAYAQAGHASIEAVDPTQSEHQAWPQTLKWTVFLPPARRMDGGNGTVAEQVFFESYTYRWKDMSFLVYFADGRDGGSANPHIRNQYILGDEAVVRTLVATVGRHDSVLHDEIWVYNKGFWQKDRNLYRSIMKSRWEDVILDKPLKEDLVGTVQHFYDSQEQYNRLRVPWKRGIIFYGPPGNGKTISIKATMHTLYSRNPPVPTLYVKTLVSLVPPEFSIDSIFAKARQEAPCYLVFEDLDSLVTDKVRSFFLNAVDGLSENEGILMVGSTNHLDRLDPGIAKRPSRFDRKYLFSDPDFDQRVKYCQYWQKKLEDNKEIEFPDEICPAAAEITDGFSFAYIQEAFVSALMAIAREKDGFQTAEEAGSMTTLHEAWDVLDIADGQPPSWSGDNKNLDDYVLWRTLKNQIELLRKEFSDE
ncbi:hypothetical protein A1O1_00778 [Capronia coronata CBS 617.96]|uniref:ATPase AAA-type core domain-containing protein n=1 Tax=Capronia coronata CBS 617.96 TaxID=1182541 RepID=W9Z256_9EURO|nr:uncharacterized protein A1O1_00778 [Capronia coronata CBS 617.96]EXJ95656.1 hypothetical protein A1O1_00778 [Capronia coronata CBS 617.96]